jgi:hypothetical protein
MDATLERYIELSKCVKNSVRVYRDEKGQIIAESDFGYVEVDPYISKRTRMVIGYDYSKSVDDCCKQKCRNDVQTYDVFVKFIKNINGEKNERQSSGNGK